MDEDGHGDSAYGDDQDQGVHGGRPGHGVRGRAHLAYGGELRRRGLNREARVHLSAARDRFEELGARTWQARAAELRATGMTRVGRGRAGTALTPQESEVARPAAGLSNPQIASRLFLSPRTVSSHLYRVFPEPGIASRAELRDALEGREAGDTVASPRPDQPPSAPPKP
ncbi:DNA-binding CsgD family transcriptional regulator [Streptomyces sp. B3I7]|uniref:helix-turn-helix transcriptional regulator n=1 Tax=Streptomyces sp. B3I7 TaxID=3042269 RepID=UPI0027803157|nr:helix-turn-helix transcriptional regulator [Streptomyces sp. B3I7]MDQ0812873.1 DNA-binding CsgD family transcriptional regulator [Streptomyces sp. B3I7]